MRSSMIPIQDSLAGLQFPAVNMDTVYVFDPVTQNYLQPYQFLEGLGWLSVNPDDEGANGPIIPVGHGFFLQRFGPGTVWGRDYCLHCSN